MIDLELEVMAHRYLYYVLIAPRISDKDYNVLLKEARLNLPPDSPVHRPAPERDMDYSAEQVGRAQVIISSAVHNWNR